MSGLNAEVIASLWRTHANCTWVSTGVNVMWSCGILHDGPIYMQPTTRDRHLAALVMTQIGADLLILAARHDAEIAAAKAAGAAEVIARVEAVLRPILANIEHALATGQAGAFPAPIAWAETAMAIRAALTTGGEDRG